MKSTKQKIAIIGTVGLPANYGGFETLTEHLVKNLDFKYDFTVYCSGKKYKKEDRKPYYRNAKLKYLPLEANGIQSIFYDTISIFHALFFADVLLILGVAGAWILPFVKFFTNKKIIISIDGIEWKRDKWNVFAKTYLFWAEKLAVKYSHIDISDNESIQDYTAYRYGSLSRIIEYGADHTLIVKPTQKDFEKYPFLMEKFAFKVCRIEPENSVHLVLSAFSQLPDHKIVIMGNWGNSTYGINLRQQYSNYSNIILLDPIYNQTTLDLIRGNASLYIHGHSAGGTNPSLVEAMYLGRPIIAFNVSYNKTTTENKAIYFKNSEELIHIIQTTRELDYEFIGRQMKIVAHRRYKWSIIASKYDQLIRESLTIHHKVPTLPLTKSIKENVLINMELGHLKHQLYLFEKR